jgi:tetratricopeptide (TPR) repeat protein
MKRIWLVTACFLLVPFFLEASLESQSDEDLFQQAKVLIFDKNWEEALAKLDELTVRYPQSPWYGQAVFYRGKCLFEQKGKEREALASFKAYLELKDRNPSLTEESEISIIDLAFSLFSRGEKAFLGEIEDRLKSSDRVLKYYAAFKLSYAADKNVAARGVPVLKSIVGAEKDAELRDRAKIALLRVAPETLSQLEEVPGPERKATILKIRVYDKGGKEPSFSLNIPWALADLALGSIPDKEKAVLRKRGYDLERLRRDLLQIKGNIIEIAGEDRTVIKIWIE